MTSPVPPAPEEGVVDAVRARVEASFMENGVGFTRGEMDARVMVAAYNALLSRLAAAEKARDEAVGVLKYIASHRGLTLLGDGTYSDGVHDGWVQVADAADAALKRDGEG